MTTRVLVVDDEKTIGWWVRQSLELGFPGCTVDVVCSGEEALAFVANAAHDLIIADYPMPGAVDGLDLIGEARRRHRDIPVILMAGPGSDSLRAGAATLGVNHYMPKPFDVGDLLAIAGQFLAHE